MLETELVSNVDATTLVERIETELRAGALNRAATAAGEVVAEDAKPRITAPGYRGDKAGLKPLRDSVIVVVREYPTLFLAVVGSSWPEGAHGHLVEHGHLQTRKDGTTFHVPPHPWLRPAIEATQDQQDAAVERELIAAAPSQ